MKYAQHELVLAPEPPVAPGDLRPDRAGEQDEAPEDHALVHADVALEVGVRVALPEVAKRLPRAADEAGVRGERDRDVEVEDPLREALVGVVRRDEEDERERRRHEGEGGGGERRQRDPGHGSIVPRSRYSVTTYSNAAQQTSAKRRS
jgi:hypothetical protein